MPSKSIYDVYFGAGKAAGEYESSLYKVSDVWGDIEQSQKMGALQTQQRERNLDAILAATELTSQVAGGLEAKKEFQSALGRVGGSIGEGVVGEKVGKGGKAWEDISRFERLFQKPQWQFGDTATMGREDIMIASEMLKYGGKPTYDRFKPKSAAEEVDLQGDFYGKKKGFDVGDIIGEKSVFAAGKQKLSSILSPEEPSQVGGAPKSDKVAESQESA